MMSLAMLGTAGFFVFALYGFFVLYRWHIAAGASWLVGAAGLLALTLLAALGGYVFIGVVRLLLHGAWISDRQVALVNGAAPWVALSALVSLRHQRTHGAR